MTQKKLFPVLGPNGNIYNADFQTEDTYAASWAAMLGRWHSTAATVQCLCRKAAPPPLVIREYRGGKYGLARHPHTGPDHDSGCKYYGPSVKGGWMEHAYLPGVVEEDKGRYKVTLGVGRDMQEPHAGVPGVEIRPAHGDGAPRQSKMTALGLLTLLWEIAALHAYRPAWAATRAKPASISGLLLDAADDVRWGKSSLAKSLQVGSAPKIGRLVEHNKAVAVSSRKQRTRLIVIGRLKAYAPPDADRPVDLVAESPVPLAGWECVRPFLTEDHLRGLQHSFARELQAWRKGAATYAILIAEPRPASKYFDLLQIALMRVSERAIPLDSCHEAAVEEALVQAGRHFDKPMRYVQDDETLPDFRLLDTGASPMPMEVFGLTNPAYQARRQEKIAMYDREYTPTGWWYWDAFNGTPMPPISKAIAV